MKYRLILTVLMTLIAVSSQVHSDEGMWLPHQIRQLDLKKLGLQMDPDSFFKKDGTGLMSAVVLLGGATGGFVSADGLLLTNHHVAYGAIQRVSDKDHDYIKEGYYAASRDLEIPAPGSIADVLLGYEDVTNKFTRALRPGMTDRQRFDAIEKTGKDLVRTGEKRGRDLVCSVKSMYSGNQYFLFTFKRLKDIRLVYAPQLALGYFGGEVDNWAWPRHTCDFTFLRAYVSKEGVGVEYNKDNVPYRPTSFLKISPEGVKENDFTFIMGYPGRTYRNNSAAETALSFDSLEKRIRQSRDLIDFYEKAGKDDRGIAIKYASRVKGLYNGLKNSLAKIDAVGLYQPLQKIQERDRAFQTWATGDPERRKKYGAILGEIEKFLPEYRQFLDRQEAASALVGAISPALLGQTYQIYRLADERQKPDLQRESGFQDRDIPAIRRRLETAERSFDLATDRELFKWAVRRIHKLYPEQLPAALKAAIPVYSEKSVAEWVDRLYDQTVLKQPERRIKLLELPLAELSRQGDPLIQLAAGLDKELRSYREKAKALGQRLTDLKRVFEAGLLQMKQNLLAPDANSTIRFTSGPVTGYSPRDGVSYLPQTTLRGVLEKDTGKEPFDVPAKLKDIARSRDFGKWLDPRLEDVPACFLNTTNVTGGNSGSPVFNARGELVGIIFDMTYESVIGDYYILPELQRSIGVDIRYVLFIADKFTGAKRLLEEMGIK